MIQTDEHDMKKRVPGSASESNLYLEGNKEISIGGWSVRTNDDGIVPDTSLNCACLH